MKRLFTILALAAVMALSTAGCAIFTEEPQVVERHYYAPNYNYYPADGVYYWYGRPYYTRPPYAAPRPPHRPPYTAPRPPHHPPYQPGYNPRPQPPRPDVHRPSPRPPRPSSPSVPARLDNQQTHQTILNTKHRDKI